MAELVQQAAKFHHSEWVISNQMKYANAEAERAASERLISETLRALDDTHKTMIDLRQQSTKRLDQRMGDIKHWKEEGETFLGYAKDQTDALVSFVARLDKALESYKETLHITNHCLMTRTKRQGVDLVHDRCEKELVKELEVFQGALALLSRSRDQAVEQLRLNRKTQYNLENDLEDKELALGVDGHCKELNERSKGTRFHDNPVRVLPDSTAVDEWLDFSKNNITAAEKVRQQSASLLSVLDEVLQGLTQDTERQVDSTNQAFTERIAETRAAKESLEDHLMNTRHQVREAEDNISRIQAAIEEKMTSLKLAHTRLVTRTHRPGVEKTRDTAQYSLVEEVSALEEILETLRERLNHSQRSLRGLERKRIELEVEIGIKTQSLHIDEVECMTIRKSMSVKCY